MGIVNLSWNLLREKLRGVSLTVSLIWSLSKGIMLILSQHEVLVLSYVLPLTVGRWKVKVEYGLFVLLHRTLFLLLHSSSQGSFSRVCNNSVLGTSFIASCFSSAFFSCLNLFTVGIQPCGDAFADVIFVGAFPSLKRIRGLIHGVLC